MDSWEVGRKYLYFEKFHQNEDGQYEVEFPNLVPNAATFRNDLSEALHMAKASLEGYILIVEDLLDKELKEDNDGLLVPIEIDTKITRECEKNAL